MSRSRWDFRSRTRIANFGRDLHNKLTPFSSLIERYWHPCWCIHYSSWLISPVRDSVHTSTGVSVLNNWTWETVVCGSYFEFMLQCVAVHVAVCCSSSCSVLQFMLQCVAVHVAECCSSCCSVLQTHFCSSANLPKNGDFALETSQTPLLTDQISKSTNFQGIISTITILTIPSKINSWRLECNFSPFLGGCTDTPEICTIVRIHYSSWLIHCMYYSSWLIHCIHYSSWRIHKHVCRYSSTINTSVRDSYIDRWVMTHTLFALWFKTHMSLI